MGRPRNDAGEMSATEKIENAFWEILENEGYHNITVLRLTQETGLNRNSIYYHYQNIEDIAKKAANHNMANPFVLSFMAALLNNQNDFVPDSEIYLHIKRIHLLARSESPFLQSFVKKILLSTWFEHFHINAYSLSEADHLTLDFIASGIISILGNDTFIRNPLAIHSFPSTCIGKAALKTLQAMSQKS